MMGQSDALPMTIPTCGVWLMRGEPEQPPAASQYREFDEVSA
jgi:hypothetical protein